MARAPRVFQFTPDPAQSLLGQGFNVIIASVLEQLCQCGRQQFGSTSIGVGFKSVPLTITDAEALMQIQRLFNRLFRPFLCRHVAFDQLCSSYPGRCDCWWQ